MEDDKKTLMSNGGIGIQKGQRKMHLSGGDRDEYSYGGDRILDFIEERLKDP